MPSKRKKSEEILEKGIEKSASEVDMILHPEVRKFLKSRALDEIAKHTLSDNERVKRQLCVGEAEFHEILAKGERPNKRKFIRSIMEAYGWLRGSKRPRGRPRKADYEK